MSLLIPAQLFSCPFDDITCVDGHVDNIFLFFYQVTENPDMLKLLLGFGLAFGFYKGFAILIISFSSAANRVILDQCRVLVVWLFFLTYTGLGHEIFSSGKLIGFLLIVTGVLHFNKIISFNCIPDIEIESDTSSIYYIQNYPTSSYSDKKWYNNPIGQ